MHKEKEFPVDQWRVLFGLRDHGCAPGGVKKDRLIELLCVEHSAPEDRLSRALDSIDRLGYVHTWERHGEEVCGLTGRGAKVLVLAGEPVRVARGVMEGRPWAVDIHASERDVYWALTIGGHEVVTRLLAQAPWWPTNDADVRAYRAARPRYECDLSHAEVKEPISAPPVEATEIAVELVVPGSNMERTTYGTPPRVPINFDITGQSELAAQAGAMVGTLMAARHRPGERFNTYRVSWAGELRSPRGACVGGRTVVGAGHGTVVSEDGPMGTYRRLPKDGERHVMLITTFIAAEMKKGVDRLSWSR